MTAGVAARRRLPPSPSPAESTSPGWRTALPGAPSLSFTTYKTTSSSLARQTPSTAAIGAGEVKLTVQLPTPAIHGPNQPLKWNPIALLKLSDPSAPSFPH